MLPRAPSEQPERSTAALSRTARGVLHLSERSLIHRQHVAIGDWGNPNAKLMGLVNQLCRDRKIAIVQGRGNDPDWANPPKKQSRA